MKKIWLLLSIILVLGVSGCGNAETSSEVVKIELSNSEILVDGERISENPKLAVYKANDIIFYMEGQGIEYGEGTEKDAHSQNEADAHTVVHITEPGIYEISGTLDAGQIFVDLGDGTKNDESAVATLVLNNVNITCTVAPAIFFYRTYECAGDIEEEDVTMDADTTAAGANIVLAQDSKNEVHGSYVAKIYESCELDETGTKVVDSKKLHKYDGAVYSRRSMNITGAGTLDIVAENEGICSEMHLTINGGALNIKSGNDGVNTSEDNISVFTMNEGTLNIQVTGESREGDGIDSNGWLIVNGGTVNSYACATSMDAGIDADKGIYINGGTVVATGNMPAEIAEGKLKAHTFISKARLEPGEEYVIKNSEANKVIEISPKNAFTMLIVAKEEMREEDTFSLWSGDVQVADGMKPSEGMDQPDKTKF